MKKIVGPIIGIVICAFLTVLSINHEAKAEFVSTGNVNTENGEIALYSEDFTNALSHYEKLADMAYFEAYTDAFASKQAKNAKIVYKYHVHVDADGNEITDDNYVASKSGGCFTTPKYHQHTSACYTVTYETHDLISSGSLNPDWGIEGGQIVCDGWPRHYYSVDDYLSGKKCVHEITTLNCSRAGQFEGYVCSCGFLNGSIESAEVTFD